MRIEAHPVARSLHVTAVNDKHHPAELHFEGRHLWRLTLVDGRGRVHTFHIDDPVRHLYWTRCLEPGQSFRATFTGLPCGTFDARIDFFAVWCDPLFLKGVTFG